jgi:hypothetical protein
MSNTIRERLAEQNPEMIFMDGFDDCLIGTCLSHGNAPVACYDVDKVVESHIKSGMTPEEAWEYLEYNQLGAFVGEGMPVFFFQDQEPA